MLFAIHPKLPMRDKSVTRDYYVNKLGFEELGDPDFAPYLMVGKDGIEIHFFEFRTLNPMENYEQVYIRTKEIEKLYLTLINDGIAIHPNGSLELKPWKQIEFSLLDPDHNLLTFGQALQD